MHVIGTAGHVDHGKSSLVQRLTGIDPDRLVEEKRRGLTIDLGFAWLTTPSGKDVGIIDVPGHERFIKNMLAGAGGISVCLFVVAANEGWMPQSAEHLTVLDVLGITHGVVAVTKADLVNDEVVDLIVAEVRERIAGTCLEGAAVVPCSSVDGRGLEELVVALDRELDRAPPARDEERPRLWIDRVFTIAGSGTVVTGTLAGGRLRGGDNIEVLPKGQRARIRAIQSHKRRLDEVGPGNRVALNLTGLGRNTVERGHAVVRPGQWRPTSTIDTVLRVLTEETSGVRHTLTGRGAHLLYCGSSETPVRLKLLERDALHGGDAGYARLMLRDPLPLAPGDRFVLRDVGRIHTFGGGRVLDPHPVPKPPRRSEHVRVLERLERAPPREALRVLLEAEGEMSSIDALLRTGARSASEAVELNGLLLSAARFESLRASAMSAVEEWHRANPLDPGMPREALRALVGLEPPDFDALVDRLEDLQENGSRVRLTSFAVELDTAQQRARDDLIRTLETSGYMPPLTDELDTSPELLRALVVSGDLVQVGNFLLTADQARRARAIVRREIERRGPLTVAEIRDLLGTSRKYAVPLCEWLDETRATIRRGDVRALGPNDRK